MKWFFFFPSHLASVSVVRSAIQKMTRVRVVDNSSLGNTPYHRAPRVIHVYTKNGIGKVGDKVLLAIKGQKKKALIVGHKMPGQRMNPRFDSNNVVLIEDNGNPTGTRIKVPLPSHLRKMEGDYSKVLAIASSFVWHSSTVHFRWMFFVCQYTLNSNHKVWWNELLGRALCTHEFFSTCLLYTMAPGAGQHIWHLSQAIVRLRSS